MATSQGHFPKWQLLKWAISQFICLFVCPIITQELGRAIVLSLVLKFKVKRKNLDAH